MLGEVVPGEAGLVGHPDELEAVLQQPVVGVPGMPSMWSKMPNVVGTKNRPLRLGVADERRPW